MIRVPGRTRGIIRFGVFEVDVDAGELRKKGLKRRLPSQPLQILLALLERPGAVVTREELRRRLWPDGVVVDFDTGLSSAVQKLRWALDDSARTPRFVETLPRRGYRFVAPVELSNLRQSIDHHGRHAPRSAITGGRITSIAILPLENLSGDASQSYFVDGMTDALITELAQIGGLRVIARTSVMHYKGSQQMLGTIARELNVEAVVVGAVMVSGERVRITARLVHAETERHLWAGSYERAVGDVVALQGEVARAIADEVQVELTPREFLPLPRGRAARAGAYDDYLKGRHYAIQDTSEGFTKAVHYFQAAIAKDPGYAPAYAWLSECYRLSGLLGPLSPLESMPKAEDAARKALALDDRLPEAHAAFAAVAFRFRWDWVGAERAFRRALMLNPNYAEVYPRYAIFLATCGRFEEAVKMAQRAQELDPMSLFSGMSMGYAFLWARRYDAAITELRRTRDRHPRSVQPQLMLGSALLLNGDLPGGIVALEAAVSVSRRNPICLACLAHGYAVAGRAAEARAILAELDERSRDLYVSPFAIAVVHAGLGDREAALTALEKAYEAHAFELVLLTREGRLDALHGDPRFQELARRIGLVV